MPEKLCFCDELGPVPCRVRVVVARHVAEINKVSNTGRLVAQGLAGAVLADHGVPQQRLDLSEALLGRAFVLATGATTLASPPDLQTLVVIDSTWANAKSMRWRIPPLADLPTLSLPPPAVIAVRRLRQGRYNEQMSTIEATAAALDFLGDPEPAAHLRHLYRLLSDRIWQMRGR